jgi:type II secretory pathway pseudopilin PulG
VEAARGFTLTELLVLIVIIVILVSIFVPYLSSLRENARRVSCVNNLKTIFAALQHYARDNGSAYPAVAKDAANPGSYTAFTGPDDPNPFAPNSSVKPNDVTASLWLLVRGGYVKDTGTFMCPSVATQKDLIHDLAGRGVPPTARGNFRRAANLSYSYASPFSASPDYKLTDTLPHDFVILADKNPGADSDVPFHASPTEQRKINSVNHGGAGENVLYAAGYVAFQWTPYCAHGNDNIYTAQSKAPPATNESVTITTIGALAPNIGPATAADSYLLPTERDGK